MPQSERLRVWKGELKKTSGGLTKPMLMKNKRGKVVSKRKSEASKKQNANNLGEWLRSKGDQFLSKGLVQENIVRKGKAGRKAFKQEKKQEEQVPEEKQAEVPATKPKPKPKPKKVVPKKVVPKKKVAKVAPAPPKITKLAPVGPGQKPKDRTNISSGNITVVHQESKVHEKQIQEIQRAGAQEAGAAAGGGRVEGTLIFSGGLDPQIDQFFSSHILTFQLEMLNLDNWVTLSFLFFLTLKKKKFN